MSSSEVALTLSCPNAAAELLVVNSDFKLVAHGTAPLSTRIDPGIYSLKAKIGSRTTERIELMDGSQAEYRFELEAPPFESPMPLQGTATSREYQQDSLSQFTGPGHASVALGEGSAVVLYVRDTSRLNFSIADDRKAAYRSNFRGFRLRDARGGELVDFDAVAVDCTAEGYIGAQIRLNAGHYMLSWRLGRHETRLAVNAVPGWTMQLFLCLQPLQPGSLEMRPDFAGAAFAYTRLDEVYSPSREDMQAMEATRLALSDQRDLAIGQTLRVLMKGETKNPMLSLYAGHILASSRSGDVELLQAVTEFAAGMLGKEHPDAVALVWICESLTKQRPSWFDQRPWPEILPSLKGPPTLLPSWEALLECAESAELDVTRLPAFHVAGQLIVSGIVLTWEHREGKATEEVLEATAGVPAAPAPSVTTRHRAPKGSATRGVTAATSVFAKWGRKLWATATQSAFGGQLAAELALAKIWPVSVDEIESAGSAADALKDVAERFAWEQLVRLGYNDPDAMDSVVAFTPLQRELIATMARMRLEPGTASGIDARFIKSVMQAHRIPLSTMAKAIGSLSRVAFSVGVVKGLNRAVKSARASSAART